MKWRLLKKKITEIKPYEKNPRRLTKKGMKDLSKSIDKFGIAEPIVINKDGTIIGGHARYLTLKQKGIKEVDCYEPEKLLSEKELKELNIRLNKNIAGEFDFDILANEFEIEDLIDWGFEPFELGLKDEDIDLLVDHKDDINNLGRVYGLVDQIDFDYEGNYDMPKLINRFVELDEIRHNIYYGRDTVEKPPYYFIYGSYSITKTNLKDAIVSFYTEDKKFEKIIIQPSVVTTNLLNAGCFACISPDFSTYFSMSKAIRLYNIYRSRWMARYWQEAGIKIIPNVIGGDIEEIQQCLLGIPKGTILSLQIHRHYTNKELAIKKKLIKEAINLIEPKALLIYSPPVEVNNPPFPRWLNSHL